jgi:hypothetical protein
MSTLQKPGARHSHSSHAPNRWGQTHAFRGVTGLAMTLVPNVCQPGSGDLSGRRDDDASALEVYLAHAEAMST